MSTNQHPGEEKNESRLKAATFAEGVAVLLLAILVLVVGINVFLRYVLNIGVEWGDEVARIVFIWIVFIGAYLAFKRNSHAVVTFLGNRVPQKWKKYHSLLIGLLEAAFILVIMWCGVVQVLDTAKFGQITAGLGVPMWVFYLVIPVTFFFMLIIILKLTFLRFTNKRGEEEWVD